MKLSGFNWRMWFYRVAFVVLWCGSSQVVAEQSGQLYPFVSGSLQQILDSRAGRPFMLVMWSRECAACMKELDILAAVRSKNPAVDIVMIATEEQADPEGLGRFLEEHDLETVESWYFSEPNQKKLQYQVDSTWYGEIPRTYFYDVDHQRVAVSGLLKPEQLDAWMAMVPAH